MLIATSKYIRNHRCSSKCDTPEVVAIGIGDGYGSISNSGGNRLDTYSNGSITEASGDSSVISIDSDNSVVSQRSPTNPAPSQPTYQAESSAMGFIVNFCAKESSNQDYESRRTRAVS